MTGFGRWTALDAALVFVFCALVKMPAFGYAEDTTARIAAGKEIAFDVDRGNCLACHIIPGGEAPGNIGPPLIAMKSRYADKETMRDVIWNQALINPKTSMPPFGKHGILSEKEIDLVTEFIWSL